ncbi:MAG: hypothetical protein Q9211_003204, partial [Gyalolechia sp. 1 TL-2023]
MTRRSSREEQLRLLTYDVDRLTEGSASKHQPLMEEDDPGQVSNIDGAPEDQEEDAQTPPVYRVYKRRWFGLMQLVLMNIIVSWD